MAKNSVQVEYMHVCDYAFTGQNGKACIIGIFDRLNARTFPVKHPIMAIALKLRGQAGHKVPVQMTLTAPDGAVLADLGSQQVPLGTDGGTHCFFMLVAAEFKVPGQYSVTATSQGEVLATQTLTVRQVKTQAA